MKKEDNCNLIENIIISIDGIYEWTKLIDVDFDTFSIDSKLIYAISFRLSEISQIAKKISLDFLDKKDLKILNKLISLDKYLIEKPSNIKSIFSLIYSRELSLLNIRLIEIQNEKFGKPVNKSQITLIKNLNKQMRFAFKTM